MPFTEIMILTHTHTQTQTHTPPTHTLGIEIYSQVLAYMVFDSLVTFNR